MTEDLFGEDYWEEFDKEKERQKVHVNPWNTSWPFTEAMSEAEAARQTALHDAASRLAEYLPGESSLAPDDDPTTGH
jgi:hypothetical protein